MTGIDGFWHSLVEPERRALRQTGVARDYAAGQTILHSAAVERWVAVLLSGTVRVVGERHGRRAVLAVRHAGDILGELSLIDGRPRSASVEAVTPVRALLLTARQLGQVMERNPRIVWALLDVVVGRLREADRRRIGFADDLRSRLAGLLVELAERDGRPAEAGLLIPITSQTDLADLAGTSRESLGRVLAELRARRLVSTERRRVIVHDLPGLRVLAGPVRVAPDGDRCGPVRSGRSTPRPR